MAASKAILLAEPEEGLGQSLAQFLREQGYAVNLARDARNALEQVRNDGIDLLLTELQLPDQSGVQLVSELIRRCPHIHCIIMNDTKIDLDLPNLRHIECLTKPIKLEELHRVVDRSMVQIQAERLQEEWMSATSHDLKIPLTSIMGCCSLLLGNQEFDESRRREMVSCIQRNGQRALAMIDNYLTMCRARSGVLSLNLEDIDLRKFVEDLIYVMQFEAERRMIRMEPNFAEDLPAAIKADEGLLQRALGNLMANAIKYSPWEALISIQLSKAALNGSSAVEFTISNPGRGIPPEEIGRIFERYHRANNIEGIEGAGLGLSVVKAVIEAHAGKVSVESNDGLTTFHVLLPA